MFCFLVERRVRESAFNSDECISIVVLNHMTFVIYVHTLIKENPPGKTDNSSNERGQHKSQQYYRNDISLASGLVIMVTMIIRKTIYPL